MANPKKKALTPKDPAQALAEIEMPGVKWNVIAQIVGAIAVLWVTAFMTVPWVGYWGVGVVGLLTLAAAGFGIYVYRLTSKQRAILDIMKAATDEKGRKHALAELSKGEEVDEDGNNKTPLDAMKSIAKAQLLAASDPNEALRVLEQVDLAKAPVMVQDEIRAQRCLLYLRGNRTRDARAMADDMRLDRQPNVKAKAFYAAVMAESLARTGAGEGAKKLIETFGAEDAEYGDVRAMLLRAQVFTYFQLKKKGLAQKAMNGLADLEPGMLAAFTIKGTQPEIVQMARQTLASAGFAPKIKMKHSP